MQMPSFAYESSGFMGNLSSLYEKLYPMQCTHSKNKGFYLLMNEYTYTGIFYFKMISFELLSSAQ